MVESTKDKKQYNEEKKEGAQPEKKFDDAADGSV
jgi:hypothetical protein